MDVQTALLTRRTTYSFRDEIVDESVVQNAVEAARWAPNHKLTEPWRFWSVGPQSRRTLSDVAARIAAQKLNIAPRPEPEKIIQKQRTKIESAPLLLIVGQHIEGTDAFRRKEDYASVASAIQNLSLSLWSNGIGVLWSTGAVTRAPELYPLIQADPNKIEIVGILRGGYPAAPREGKRLKSVGDIFVELS